MSPGEAMSLTIDTLVSRHEAHLTQAEQAIDALNKILGS